MNRRELSNARREEMQRIADEHDGELRPRDVVDFAAENAKSALHDYFEWDDGKAGDEYRLGQARRLIRVWVTVLPSTTKPVRAFVSLKKDRKKEHGGYRMTVDVLSDEQRTAQMLQDAKEYMESFRHRFADIKWLVSRADAIVDAIESEQKAIEQRMKQQHRRRGKGSKGAPAVAAVGA